MSMLRFISGLRAVDQVVIYLFAFFILWFIVVLFIYMRHDIRKAVMDSLLTASVKVEQFIRRMRDDESFDPAWMDYDAWKQTRIENRRRV